ncbi:MAG TPA: hypothetical protein VMT54_01035 [Candidatus Cybelea sp.]|nr:hypothetical protein [Candidatus Cybelea sp.]
MKKLLIILVVLLLLGGGGGAAWWFYFRKDSNAPPPVPPPPQLSELTIPSRDSLTISVMKDGKVELHYFLIINLIFDDPKKRDLANRVLPALTNDFVVELHTLLARKLVEESNRDDKIRIIQIELQKVCDRRLGKGVVNQVSIPNMEQAE